MRERPILFNGPMVSAILDGTKTQTRRVVKPQPKTTKRTGWYADLYNHGLRWAFWLTDGRMSEPRTWPCPYGVPGDTLWLRETWGCPIADHPGVKGGRRPQPGDSIVYRAELADAFQWDNPGHPGISDFVWRPSIHMPRWASRIELDVTGVRVEQVQSISNDDAAAEGCPGYCHGDDGQMPWDEFRELWDSINAKRGYGWNENPWVWVVEFRRTR